METNDSVYEKAPPYHARPNTIPTYVSETNYWRFYYEHPDDSYEWNNGKLEKRPMSDKQSLLLYLWFLGLLGEYLEVFPEGERIGQEIGFIMDFDDKRVIRKPDLAIIHSDNPTKFELTDRTYQGTCDICIEFLSDSTPQEAERDTIQKKQEYAKAGVREYFILDGKHEQTAFYRLSDIKDDNTEALYHSIDSGKKGIIRSHVLSNFAFRLEHLHSLPNYKSLIDDPVYRSYIVKSLQAERQAKETALKQVAQEQQAIKREQQEKEAALARTEIERREKEAAIAREKIERKEKEAAIAREEAERKEKEALQAELEQLRAKFNA